VLAPGCGWFHRNRHVSSCTVGESVHPLVAVDLAGRELILAATDQSASIDSGGPAPAARDDVVDLEAQGGTAGASGIEGPRALAVVARPDRAPHRGGDVAGVLRRAGVLLRLLHFGAALGLQGEKEVM